MKTTFFFACVMMILCHGVHATPWRNTGRPDELSIFPHSLCNSDFICTGTPTSTNDGHSAEFAVDEILWGSSPSTNITIRYLSNLKNVTSSNLAKDTLCAHSQMTGGL